MPVTSLNEGGRGVGLFKDARQAAQGAFGQAGVPPAGGMPDMASMGMPDPAYVQKVNRIGQSGVEAPADLHEIRAVGSSDISGATPHEFDVTVRPADADPYQTTIQQSMLLMQIQGLSPGQAVTVKYDPDNPSAALLHSW
jgi:hypothetical protein